MDRVVEPTSTGPAVGEASVPREWQLAAGVGLVEGTVIGAGQAAGRHAYTVVLPSGRRFEVSESLYRLAELLAGRRTLSEITARLAERLGRPFSEAEVAALVERKLASQGIATPR
jgi:hypothetical protein